MNEQRWLDREFSKSKLRDWISAPSSVFYVNVLDSQEYSDIYLWLKEEFKEFLIGRAIFDSDVDIQKHMVLEDLARDIGEKLFVEFFAFLNDYESDLPPVSITQTIGENVFARKDITFEDVDQFAKVLVDPHEYSLEYQRERKEPKLREAFINDVLSHVKKNRFLFIIQFGKEGFVSLSAEFRRWFLNSFCRRLSKVTNVKICIINHGYESDLSPIDAEKEILEALRFEDIIGITKQHLEQYEEFCLGAIDPDSNLISYYEFKRKWQTRLHKLENLNKE